MVFRPLAPLLEYQQNDSISFCFGSLASVYTVSVEMLPQGIFHCELSHRLNFQSKGFLDRIKFSNTIMLDK